MRALYSLFCALTCTLSAQNLAPKGFSFNPASGLSNRLLTPNGDGRNDYVVFTFDNPRDSQVTGKIYDLGGKLVAEMESGPVAATTLRWNGKSVGQAVASGVYFYLIEAESKTYSGTVVVVK